MEHRSARAAARWGIPLLVAVTGGCSAPPAGSDSEGATRLDDSVVTSVSSTVNGNGEKLRYGGRPAFCPASETACDRGCFDLQQDQNHCGACDVPCPAGNRCERGRCVGPLCTSDQVTCGDGCCGPTDQMQCVSGACQPICDHAQPLCGGVCCPQGQLCNDAGVCSGE